MSEAERLQPMIDEPWNYNGDDIRSLATELLGLQEKHAEDLHEVANVLILMDGLAQQWGDEGVFRRCRDRLRKLVPATQTHPE